MKNQLWPIKKYAMGRLFGMPPIPWFTFPANLSLRFVPSLHPIFIPDGDFVIATGWQTAEYVKDYPRSKGHRLYIVYDYEFWKVCDAETRNRIENTYRAGLDMIATSPATEEVLGVAGVRPAACIAPGIDLKGFNILVHPDQRDRYSIGFTARKEGHKGLADALEAVRLLRDRYGDMVRFSAFGPQPIDLPDRIDFRPNLPPDAIVGFYNSIAIFMFASHYEGWGLPAMEALACGAALATSDSVGLRDFAINEQTALLVPIKRPDLLANAVARLIDSDALRQRLALAGHDYVQRYTWDRNVDALEQLLSSYD